MYKRSYMIYKGMSWECCMRMSYMITISIVINNDVTQMSTREKMFFHIQNMLATA